MVVVNVFTTTKLTDKIAKRIRDVTQTLLFFFTTPINRAIKRITGNRSRMISVVFMVIILFMYSAD